MLRPEEFQAGDLATASVDSLTLVLPRSEYEQAALIGDAFNERYGVILDGDLPFQAYAIKDDGPWSGMLIPHVRIEVDEKSAYNPAQRVEAGTIIREDDLLIVAAVAGPHPQIGRPAMIAIGGGLPPCQKHERAGFRRWRIVLGTGYDTRELMSVDALRIAEIRSATLQSGR